MPQFSNEAPPESTRPGFRLIRTPAQRSVVAIVTCDDLVGCPTHFYRNRTLPCEAPNCEPCNTGHAWRWHGYVSCVDQSSHEHILFEMTAQASDAFRDYRKEHNTLRGCLFKASRVSFRYNGRVVIRCKPADLAGVTLPGPPNIPVMLCHIWNIPTPDVKTNGKSKGHPKLAVDRARDGDGQERIPSHAR